jgi:hypothetical protein|tara:strand:+ start:1472 stop:1591 length:120 start_codon:yes stop_codon:yes gene_type:complete
MNKIIYIIPLALVIACGDKEEDTGDTGVEVAEEDTAGDE